MRVILASSHSALERLAAHLAVRDNFESRRFLQRDGIVHGAVFDLLELSGAHGSGGELILRLE